MITSEIAVNYIRIENLPQTGKGDDMKITEIGRDKNGMKRYQIDHSARVPGRKNPDHIRRIVAGSTALSNAIADIKRISEGGDVRSKTFGQCSEFYKKHIGYKTKSDVFEREKKDLGAFRIDDRFPAIYQEYIAAIGQGRKTNTVNNYRICVRSILNYCYRQRYIREQPIRDFGLKPIDERDRIWTHAERQSIYNVMDLVGSHLYWSVRFAEKNPIRGESDLWKLSRNDLVLFGDMSPCIQFNAKKTGNTTFLIELDRDMLDNFQWQFNTIPDCPYLFPRIWQDEHGTYRWAPMGSPIRHWRYICKKANVSDFHFHDLRHVATTYMLEKRDDSGIRVYDEDDLKSLGIFYSTKAVEIYRNRKAERVIERVRGMYNVCNNSDQLQNGPTVSRVSASR